jgi:hypothetical protein
MSSDRDGRPTCAETAQSSRICSRYSAADADRLNAGVECGHQDASPRARVVGFHVPVAFITDMPGAKHPDERVRVRRSAGQRSRAKIENGQLYNRVTSSRANIKNGQSPGAE